MRLKLWAVGALLLSLSGCDDPVRDAKRELEIIESTGGSSQELCAAKKKLAAAYLAAHDAASYETSRVYADIACMNADLERRYGAPPRATTPSP